MLKEVGNYGHFVRMSVLHLFQLFQYYNLKKKKKEKKKRRKQKLNEYRYRGQFGKLIGTTANFIVHHE